MFDILNLKTNTYRSRPTEILSRAFSSYQSDTFSGGWTDQTHRHVQSIIPSLFGEGGSIACKKQDVLTDKMLSNPAEHLNCYDRLGI